MSARSCRDVRADLSAYLDGDLDAGLVGETHAHLESCAACRSELEELRLTVGALRRLPELPPPAAILAGVRARLRPEPWYQRLLDGRQWSLGVPIGALATVLVIIGISLYQVHYPDMQKTITQSPFLESPAPPALEKQIKESPIAVPSPAARDMGAGRQSALPPPLARNVLRAKGALGSATLPQGAAGGREFNAPESSAGAGAVARDDNRATPAAPAASAAPAAPIALEVPAAPATLSAPAPLAAPAAPAVRTATLKPVEPVAQNKLAVVESKVEKSLPAQTESSAAAPKDARREESRRGDNIAAAPSPSASPKLRRAMERTVSIDESAAARSARVLTPPDRDSNAIDRLNTEAETSALPLDKKKESSAVYARKADSGADLGGAQLAGAKASAKTWIEVVCLLHADGDTVQDLEQLLRREGAAALDVSSLEPPALREAFSRQRGRLVNLSEPSRGWTVTARVQAPALARLLEVLKSRPSLRILEQPAAPPSPEDPTAPLDLRITVLR